MPRPRSQLIDVDTTPFYHLTSRCVRRTFLCGYDVATGKSYEHRKQLIEERIRLLSSLFAVDVCAYAVMSNHYHIVVKAVPEQANQWSADDVLQRWRCLFKGSLLVQKYANEEPLSPVELNTVLETLNVYQDRLTSLSWFMRCLNEPIARMANLEDGCTGHFWEARFSSQSLPTEAAVLSAMVYVDLNPLRAGIASTPETSEHTSIKERINPNLNLEKAITSQLDSDSFKKFNFELKPLAKLPGESEPSPNPFLTTLPINYLEYLKLVDWSGRMQRHGKRGIISNQAPSILERLLITAFDWHLYSGDFEKQHRRGAFR